MHLHKLLKIRAILFDLDDTLYDQTQYNLGAFELISRLVHSEAGIDQERVFEKLREIYKRNTMSGKRNLNELVSELGIEIPAEFRSEGEYAMHLARDGYHGFKPTTLTLYDGAMATLKELKRRGLKLGIITDGNVSTQKRKIEALGIAWLFDAIIYSADSTVSKGTSKLPYLAALNSTGIDHGENAMMVGDNPLADFHFANSLGMTTVRVATGEYSAIMPATQAQQPHYTVTDLSGILQIIKA